MRPLFSTRLGLIMIGVFATLLLFLPVRLYQTFPSFFSSLFYSSDRSVITLGSSAFGSLVATDEPQTGDTLGMGGGKEITSEEAVLSNGLLPAEYYPTISYRYVYEGTLPDFSTFPSFVYKRSSMIEAPESIARAVSSSTIGSFDFSRLGNLTLQNMYLAQEGDKGYAVGVDFTYGSLYINQNWNTWTEDVYTPLAFSDLPPFEQVIAVADAFLADFGLDRTGYGSGVITDADLFTENSLYIPDEATVVYPKNLEGYTVWDLYGTPQGMMVGVNLRTLQATRLSVGLDGQFASSSYPMVTDEALVRGVIERGGLYGWSDPSADTIYTVKVGDPVYGLAHYFLYQDGKTEYLYLPALYFPVIEVPEGAEVWQDAVVVPLAEEVLREVEEGYPILYDKSVVELITEE
ncbi:TPA: hypothetical protein DEP34_02805 [Candidatus Uhrbacteria bacterium]|uniref:Uncharacterized protein n=2 Tax=Candidatus Uhriibacteriota TaxID=1752732 RepID=A0A0G1T7M3_9BACT|nr:MAG: hypothetical protein UX45_C0001G0006 [Candidatus Uhrbacteria bacterium GW2011_GWF2_46_218]KKU41430.1 MAG: hypothetical protein UX57_C0004G0134 [Candidatus Uhrbacteria bacterium GW2011_GWE2_46_68]HBK33868.1 hypothetical protein [Candidatus Uhrbacteria bacterium]HCB19292.1 hypothetical protein [Candidatus Uhrbacteria bacterium]